MNTAESDNPNRDIIALPGRDDDDENVGDERSTRRSEAPRRERRLVFARLGARASLGSARLAQRE